MLGNRGEMPPYPQDLQEEKYVPLAKAFKPKSDATIARREPAERITAGPKLESAAVVFCCGLGWVRVNTGQGK